MAHAIFCDDIRQELGDKVSLMGMYAADLTLMAMPPVMLPTFGIVASLICDVGDVPTKIQVIVYAPDRLEVLNTEVPLDQIVIPRADDLLKVSYTARLKFSPFPVPAVGLIEVIIETELGRLRAGRLQVRLDGGAGGAPAPV